MPRHGLDAQAMPAQLHGVCGQAVRHPLRGINEVELLDAHAATGVAPDLAMLDLQHHGVPAERQITYELAGMRVNRPRQASAGMAERPVPLVRLDADEGSRIVAHHTLIHDFDSTPWEISGYTESGHRAPPFQAKQTLFTQTPVYPAESRCPLSFKALRHQLFGRRAINKLFNFSTSATGYSSNRRGTRKALIGVWSTPRWSP